MIYVDDTRLRSLHGIMCHLVADTIEELYHTADKLGLSRTNVVGAAHGTPHFEINQRLRKDAIKMGAKEVKLQELLPVFERLRNVYHPTIGNNQ